MSMHNDRAEAVQKCFSFKSSETKRWPSLLFKHRLLPNIRALTPADDLHSLLELKKFSETGNNLVTSLVEGDQEGFYLTVNFGLCIVEADEFFPPLHYNMYNWKCSPKLKEKGLMQIKNKDF